MDGNGWLYSVRPARIINRNPDVQMSLGRAKNKSGIYGRNQGTLDGKKGTRKPRSGLKAIEVTPCETYDAIDDPEDVSDCLIPEKTLITVQIYLRQSARNLYRDSIWLPH